MRFGDHRTAGHDRWARTARGGGEGIFDSVRTDLHGLESRTRGRYAESLIVHTLGQGAHRSTYAAAAWDVCWAGIALGVRTVGQYTSETESTTDEDMVDSSMRWSFPKRSALTTDLEWSTSKRRAWTDAVVLAIHRGRSITEGWSFIILDGKTLDQENVASLGIPRALTLSIIDEELTPAELRGSLERSFGGRNREPTRGARFPVSCDDDLAHEQATQRR